MTVGGKRKGSGRKPKSQHGPRLRRTFLLDPPLVEGLKIVADGFGLSQNDIVNICLGQLISVYNKQKDRT